MDLCHLFDRSANSQSIKSSLLCLQSKLTENFLQMISNLLYFPIRITKYGATVHI